MNKKLFVVLLFIFWGTTRAQSDILKEYPELGTLLNSTEFKSLTKDYPLSIAPGDLGRETIACVSYTVGNNGIKKTLALNPSYINKDIISAEEWKYILCHELGHLHDKNLKNHIISSIAFELAPTILVILLTADAFQKKWSSLITKASLGLVVLTAWNLLLKKSARNGEFFADEFAIKLTKNKKAAGSILDKRAKLVGTKKYKYVILKKLNAYFEDHPSEEERINHMNNVQLVKR